MKKRTQVITAKNGGGYAPGRMVRRKTLVISPADVERFQLSLAQINFWRLPSVRKSDILDANIFLYEADFKGHYHIVQVTEPGFAYLLPPAGILMKLVDEPIPN